MTTSAIDVPGVLPGSADSAAAAEGEESSAQLPREVREAMAATERLLTERFGARVTVTEPEDLGGSERSIVLRLRLAENPFSLPRTLICKRYVGRESDASGPIAGDPFLHEAASSQLFTALAIEDRVSPELIAQDSANRILVLEDLGRAPTLSEVLLGEDSRVAEQAVAGWARALGRMHVATAGRDTDFDALGRRLGVPRWIDPLQQDQDRAMRELPGLMRHHWQVDVSHQLCELTSQASTLLAEGPYRAFSPSDVCPDNTLVTSQGARFLDFEWSCVRDVAIDAAHLSIPFGTCWCAHSLPRRARQIMLDTWRGEVTGVWPDLADDAVLLPRLLGAQLLWTWMSSWRWLSEDVADHVVDASSPSAPLAALVQRWSSLQQAAEDVVARAPELGQQPLVGSAAAIAELCRRVHAALRQRYPDQQQELPTYPAFGSES